MDPPTVQNAPPSASSKKNKRKAEDDDVQELRQKAKYHCKDIKEWRVISKYSKQKLEH